MEMEKREAVAGDLFLELEEIEKLCKNKEKDVNEKSTLGHQPFYTIACC